MTFTDDEQMLALIYGNGTRTGLITALKNMRKVLQPDEKELCTMADSLIDKLCRTTDDDFVESSAFF